MDQPLDADSPEKPLDDAVIRILVENHRRFLSFLERRVESKDAAEEILQAALTKAVEKGGELRDNESAVAWFFRLLRNTVIDHYRRRAARERMLESQARDAEDAISDDELRGVVCACFEDLLPTLKNEYALILRAVDLESRADLRRARVPRLLLRTLFVRRPALSRACQPDASSGHRL